MEETFEDNKTLLHTVEEDCKTIRFLYEDNKILTARASALENASFGMTGSFTVEHYEEIMTRLTIIDIPAHWAHVHTDSDNMVQSLFERVNALELSPPVATDDPIPVECIYTVDSNDPYIVALGAVMDKHSHETLDAVATVENRYPKETFADFFPSPLDQAPNLGFLTIRKQ
jgi:hypothetical protein